MLKVLIVDDESMVRKGIVLGFDWAALDCVIVGEATNGEEGLAAVEAYNPNLIITDVRMPRMDGLEMLSELRRRGNRAHVILLTAYSDFSYARNALQNGADDYLLKPFHNQDLVAAINRIQQKVQERSALTPQDVLPLTKGDKSKYVLLAMNYIAEHYCDPGIGITMIANSLHVSEGHLSHVFKKETTYTIVGYLTQYRIHTAMKLLQDYRYKIYEVAEMVGYRDVAYFGSTFKKLTGLSPSDYQDRCR
ncbi:MAG: response regulator [Ruminiclostridium sp.]|nr:response regulator [Dehalococcoidales bacterium]NLO40808.1 response regulator [Ruminiclostridium sp.]